MDRELIIRLAREVGLWEMLEGYSSEYGTLDAEEDCLPNLQRFAALVAAREREECAKLCDDRVVAYRYATDSWAQEHIDEARHLAAAIRSRGT